MYLELIKLDVTLIKNNYIMQLGKNKSNFLTKYHTSMDGEISAF